jgi:beta-phosphoglucomutase family hydrolase
MRGAIFDLDGTIVDNMPVHVEAFAIFAERHGLPPLTLDDRRRLDGRRNREIFPDLFGRPLSPEELRAFTDEKEALYRARSAGRLSVLPGLIRLLDRLDAHQIPVAIASSAPPENIRHTLAELGLATRLTRIVRGDEVPHGKPAPDIFLEAASRLGVPPGECTAFEDALAGIAAARAAGMVAIAVTTSFSADVFRSASVGADAVVADFEEFLRGPGRWLDEAPPGGRRARVLATGPARG